MTEQEQSLEQVLGYGDNWKSLCAVVAAEDYYQQNGERGLETVAKIIEDAVTKAGVPTNGIYRAAVHTPQGLVKAVQEVSKDYNQIYGTKTIQELVEDNQDDIKADLGEEEFENAMTSVSKYATETYKDVKAKLAAAQLDIQGFQNGAAGYTEEKSNKAQEVVRDYNFFLTQVERVKRDQEHRAAEPIILAAEREQRREPYRTRAADDYVDRAAEQD